MKPQVCLHNPWRRTFHRVGLVTCILVTFTVVIGKASEAFFSRGLSYDQYLFSVTFRLSEVLLLAACVMGCITVHLSCAQILVRRVSLVCVMIVLAVFLVDHSSLRGPKIRACDMCYLAMNEIEADRIQLKESGKESSLAKVLVGFGRSGVCPSGGCYSLSTNGVLKCSIHGEQYPRWIVRSIARRVQQSAVKRKGQGVKSGD